MFGQEFYPTPDEVIAKMLHPYRTSILKENREHSRFYPKFTGISDLTILEPSAGKGNILDFIQEHSNCKSLYCCEINPDLKFILQEKNYQVISDDFLNYTGDLLFDLIIMNPPFSNADQHILKAWELIDEGEIIALINSETVNNPYSQRRKLINELIEQHGSVEHIGAVFQDAERKTSVDCSIVRLTKHAVERKFDFEFENVTSERPHELNEDTFKDPIATNDIIGNMMIQFDQLKNLFTETLKIREGMDFYSGGLFSEHTSIQDMVQNSIDEHYRYQGNRKVLDKRKSYNEFCNRARQRMWSVVLSKTNVEKYMTHGVRTNFQQFCKHQGHLDFTKENVANLVTMVFNNRVNIMEQAIVDVFDIFTQYHKENRLHIEGWKTNDKWKVNKKIILPYGLTFGRFDNMEWYRNYGSTFEVSHEKSSQYSDIDKVMCYLTGTRYESCFGITDALRQAFDRIGKVFPGDKFDNTVVSQFFKIKFFKKGTMHLEFIDDNLWQEFNIRACAGKNWLPESEMKDYQANREPSQKPQAQQLTLLSA